MYGWNVGDRVLATDIYGNFHNKPCTVTGFETSKTGRPLVVVELDDGGTETVFYPNELIRLEIE